MRPKEKVGGTVLARLVSHPATLREVLATTEDVSNQPVSVEEAVFRDRLGAVCRSDRPWPLNRPFQAGCDQRPAPTYPVAVAAVDKLVGATREASFRRNLP